MALQHRTLILFIFYSRVRTQIFQQGRGYFVEGARHGSLNILGNLLATHQFGKELLMEKTSLVSNIPHVDASLCVESNALVYIMELAVKNIVGMLIFFSYVAIKANYSNKTSEWWTMANKFQVKYKICDV